MSTPAQRRLQNLPYHCEHLFALIREENGMTTMCYRFEKSPSALYRAICEEETLGTRHTPDSLKLAGWVARPVRVEELWKR